jgi:pyrimidine 5'-nucleotidase
MYFDLDDTIYPSSSGLWLDIRARMEKYMHERLGLTWDQIPEIRQMYLEKHGTTLRGLQLNYQVNSDDYLSYVHNLPLERYLQPNPELRSLLLSLPQRRWIFTNADKKHAIRVLDTLELSDCFHGIIDLLAMDFACKPEKDAYIRALQISGNPNPENCILLDDAPRNLAPAQELGFLTILVGSNGHHPKANHSIRNLTDLHQKVPELWADI